MSKLTDAEIERRYHELQVKKLQQANKPKEIRATDTSFFFEKCPCCGTGRVPTSKLNGWWISYHYQDGHEECGPYTKEQAIKIYSGHSDGSSIATLIGPDNKVYVLQ